MKGTRSTSTTTSRAAVPLAMLAVAQHAVDHGLTADGIDSPVVDGDPITIRVRSTSLQAWLETVELLDDPIIRPLGQEARSHETFRQLARVTAPIGLVKVVVMCVRRTAPPLHVVPSRPAAAGAAS